MTNLSLAVDNTSITRNFDKLKGRIIEYIRLFGSDYVRIEWSDGTKVLYFQNQIKIRFGALYLL